MPLTNAAKHQPRVVPADVSSVPYKGIRGSGTAATTTVVVTVTAATVASEWGFSTRGTDGSVQLGVTDLIAYSDTAGALLTIKSGATIIWSTYLAVGILDHNFHTAIMADEGADLVLTITGATSKCSIAMSGQGLYAHKH